MDIKQALKRIAQGKDLQGTEMRDVMNIIMSGEASEAQIGAFLMGMAVKGETVGEIAAAVSILKQHMITVQAPKNALDIVGTGGDGVGTYNISTGAAFVIAGGGVPVAKHGNKALSSQSGSSDALSALGVNLNLTPEQISHTINSIGIGFMAAPNHHPSMRFVAAARQQMGVRTMFNLLGPQANPAGARLYVLGVYDNQWVEPVAASLLANQAKSAWVMHGHSGLDELSTTGTNFVSQIKNGNLTSFEVEPEDAGLPRAKIEDLVGGTPEYNAKALRNMLAGEKSAYRDIVLFNAAAAFIVADTVQTLKEGVEFGAEIIDSGKALAKLDALVAATSGA